MTLHRILCPTDFSNGAHHAMRTAVQLAIDADAELVLCHVWYVPSIAFSGEGVYPADALARMRDEAFAQLEAARGDAVALGARRVSLLFVEGQPWQKIVAALDDPTIDLAVIGTHGRTGLARVLLGSVAENVVRHAPCSVLTVGPQAVIQRFTHALCPVDFSERTQYALQLAADFVRPARAGRLTMLHVIEAPVPFTGEPLRGDFVRDLDKAGVEALERWAGKVAPEAKVPVATRIRIGHPGAQSLAVLDDDPSIDLVAMATHGRTGVARVLLGSIAEKLVRHAHCPVLVARKRA